MKLSLPRRIEYYRCYVGGPVDGREDRVPIRCRTKIPTVIDKPCYPDGPRGARQSHFYRCAEPVHVPVRNERIVYEFTGDADAPHNNSLCSEGVGFRYDPNSVAAHS
jgi:hypothetical protein